MILTNNSQDCHSPISQELRAMKYGQLIEHNNRNFLNIVFLEKSYTKRGGETIPRPFSKKSKLNISLDQKSKSFIQFFIVCQVEDYQNIWKLSYSRLSYLI